MAKNIGIVGTRRRDARKDYRVVEDTFQLVYRRGDRIISGGCPKGGDRFAEVLAIQIGYYVHIGWDFEYYHPSSDDKLDWWLGLTAKERQVQIARLKAPITIYHPDWERYGRGAGIVRNTDIANVSTILIACVASDRTGGTEDTIRKFIRYHGKRYLFLV